MSAGCDVRFDTTGVVKLVKMLDKAGKSPQKAITRAASKGITPVKRAVRGIVPVGETGNLKRAIARKAEKSRARGKKVYEVTFDKAYNDVLQKPVKNPGEAGSTTTKSGHAYYPASIEYGFLTRSKGNGYSYVPGVHFMRQGAEQSETQAKQIMIDTMEKELDKLWQQAQHA